MARTKQALKGRAKTHIKRTLRLCKRKNKLRAGRRQSRNRPHRRPSSGKR
jgi:hypothetical protein